MIEPIGGMNFTPDPSKRGNQAPPYAIETLAGYLRAKGYEAEIVHQRPVKVPKGLIDPNLAGDEARQEVDIEITDDLMVEMILDKTKGNPSMIVGISAITPLFNRSLKIARQVKLRNPEVKVVIGGYHPSGVRENVYKSKKLNAWETQLKQELLAKRLSEYPHEELTDDLRRGIQAEINKINLVDFFVVGEGEQTILELADAIKEGRSDFSDIQGIIYRELNEETKTFDIHELKERPRIRPQIEEGYIHLDPAYRQMEVPLTDREGRYIGSRSVPTDLGCTQFGTNPPDDKIHGEIQISYSRGCPFQCGFCSSEKIWGDDTTKASSCGVRACASCSKECKSKQEVRDLVTFRNPKEVVKEILNYKKERGTNYVYFADLTFNADITEMTKLMEEMIRSGEFGGQDEGFDKVRWFCLAKAFQVQNLSIDETKKVLSLMKEAGCAKIGFGIEGFSAEDLIAMKEPGQSPEEARELGIDRYTDAILSMKLASEAGIFTRGYLMWGTPGQDQYSEARAKALLQIRIPEELFEDQPKLREVVSVIFDLQGGLKEDGDNKRPYTAEEIEQEILSKFGDGLAERDNITMSRLLEMDHLRVAPITPYPGTSIASEARLRYYDCYRYDLLQENQSQNGLMDHDAEDIGIVLRDSKGNIIPKRITNEGRILEVRIDEKGRVETDGGGKIIYYLDGEPVDEETVRETRTSIKEDGRTLDQAVNEGWDDFELLDQETVSMLTDFEIDQIMAFTKKELIDSFYGSDGYRESVQKRVEDHPELREAYQRWQEFWQKMGKEYDWEIKEDKETKREVVQEVTSQPPFEGGFREGRGF